MHAKSKLLLFIGFLLIALSLPHISYAATGSITNTNVSCTNGKITISGSYIVSEDDTPSGQVSNSPHCTNSSNRRPASYRSVVAYPGTNGTHAYLFLEIDGGEKKILEIVLSEISQYNPWTHIGQIRNFSTTIDTAALQGGPHTFKVFLQDTFGVYCYGASYMKEHLGSIMDMESFSFFAPPEGYEGDCIELVAPKESDDSFGPSCP